MSLRHVWTLSWLWLVLPASAWSAEPPAADHWAFRPIRRVAAPAAIGHARALNPIDAFVASRLVAAGVTMAEEADSLTLLRRVTLDLTGLPPTLDEVERYLTDSGPDVYERAVDRLLASPHFGERWARPWLDLCHYADTDGYLTDQARPVAWRYRQWLIDALNRDQPFDQFTIDQLAGDLLPGATTPQRLATGFLRNTLSNREGGADLEEYRVEQIVDRTMIVATSWLGLTIGCARCHDHKYEPISQVDFYRFYALLDQADEVNVDVPLSGDDATFAAKYADYRRQRDELLAPIHTEVAALQAQWEQKMLDAVAAPSKDPIWDRQWEVLGLIWGGHFGEGQLEGCVIVRTPLADRTQDEQDRLLDYFLAQGSLVDSQKFTDLKLADLKKKIDELKKSVPWPTRAPIMRQARFARPVNVHIGGDFRIPGEVVRPGVLDWLTPGRSQRATVDSDQPPTRLDLARWLVDPNNPLPPRVVVNRVWQELMGRGLVDPPNDFGLRGQPPSHGELLDWLAAEFLARDWQTKPMQRLVVTSATYRQSSHGRPELSRRDPQNRLWARQVPLRYSADQVRDAALETSGLLVHRVGGPSVFPPQPENVAKEGFSNVWKTSEGADRYRRGLYTWLQRLSPFAQNVTFDAPPANSICARRDRTNSPLQALTLLNDPVFFEAAQALARQALLETATDDRGRLGWLVRRTLSRPASDIELKHLETYLTDQRKLLADEPPSATRPTPDSPPLAHAAELAAWTSVASVILNLHEFITRD